MFLAEKIRETKTSPYHIQSDTKVYLVDKQQGLDAIFHDSAKSILIEWINGFASKSEKDLDLVIKFLIQQQELLKKYYPDTSDMNLYINRLYENFRNMDKSIKSINEIKIILDNLHI